jgi:hypothetical protein
VIGAGPLELELKESRRGDDDRSVKVVVVACLEPERLELSLAALALWVDRGDVIVLNNGNTPARTGMIEDVCMRAGVRTVRVHWCFRNEDTIRFIHEGLKTVCRLFPDEVMLKIDDDMIIVSEQDRFDVEPGKLLVPGITINNYTTRRYLEHLRPDLAAAVEGHPWMWHWDQHPVTGLDHRSDLLAAIYDADPLQLREFAERHGWVEEIGRDRWEECRLMGDAGEQKRGISSHAIAVRAADYLELCGEGEGIEEVLLAEAVWDGRAVYRVDHGIFAHHVTYWPMRESVMAMGDAVERYCRRILDSYS